MHHATTPTPVARSQTARLRVLATTDLHMQLRGFDYVTETPTYHAGLASLATLIAQARTEAHDQGFCSILLDNGDTLQGNALASWLAQQPVTQDHPIVSTMNTLGYDAIGIGNHDLDHGLPYLLEIAHHLNMPVVASNLTGPHLDPLVKTALLPCVLPLPDGQQTENLTVGILSVLPEQTAMWNKPVLSGKADVTPVMDTLKPAIATLRAQGADVVLVLAHMGIDRGDTKQTLTSSSALALAGIEGVDALITGHTHLRFPGKDHSHGGDVDTTLGTLAGRPAVMAGHAGSDLAVLDLTLQRNTEGGWSVTDHISRLLKKTQPTHRRILQF